MPDIKLTGKPMEQRISDRLQVRRSARTRNPTS